MTREEFVRNNSWILKVIRDRCKLTQVEINYLNHLIEVLEQEPCGDCISRAEAIKAIRNYNVTIEVGRAIGKSQLADIVDSINKVQEKMISELPSIQPKPKTDVLDKIRAEIKEESRFCPLTEGLERALEIIDKYKAESEDKE